MLLKWLATLLLVHTESADGEQAPLTNVKTHKNTAKLSIENCWHWKYTTQIAVGNPPVYFEAVIETESSDLFVPTVKCEEPEYCHKHPLYNSSASSTYIPDGRAASVSNGLYYSDGFASIDSYHVGGIEVKNQTFEEAVILRPSYFFPESWHDSSLSLARQVVYDEEYSDLHAVSPFLNMVKQGVLEEDVFSLRLPRTMHEAGFLLLGARGENFDATSAMQLPLLPPHNYTKYKYREAYFSSGGWEVDPVYLRFGTGEHEIYYDLRGFVAKFSTAYPEIGFPSSFTRNLLNQLRDPDSGRSGMKCEDIGPFLPNLTIALRGVEGRVEEFVLTYEDYAKDIFSLLDPGSEWCSLPFVELNETPDAPKFILLGATFLRKYYTTFDEGAESIFFSPLPST